ncbi:MAG: Pathogenicity locus [Candidatus Pacebacteria bacterium]|nr:Pathogenicity locus [Candidatus Paceibacterota bacterium]
MKDQLKNLQTIPGVGKSIAEDFYDIGIKKVSDLEGKDPEKLYLQICTKKGEQVDKCMCYVCRSSVYFAQHKKHDTEKLKWWNWKD